MAQLHGSTLGSTQPCNEGDGDVMGVCSLQCTPMGLQNMVAGDLLTLNFAIPDAAPHSSPCSPLSVPPTSQISIKIAPQLELSLQTQSCLIEELNPMMLYELQSQLCPYERFFGAVLRLLELLGETLPQSTFIMCSFHPAAPVLPWMGKHTGMQDSQANLHCSRDLDCLLEQH